MSKYSSHPCSPKIWVCHTTWNWHSESLQSAHLLDQRSSWSSHQPFPRCSTDTSAWAHPSGEFMGSVIDVISPQAEHTLTQVYAIFQAMTRWKTQGKHMANTWKIWRRNTSRYMEVSMVVPLHHPLFHGSFHEKSSISLSYSSFHLLYSIRIMGRTLFGTQLNWPGVPTSFSSPVAFLGV